MSFFESLESRLLMARVLGVDVSHYQGTVNWASVFTSGRRFAFQKSTEGVTYTDPTFATNMLAGKAAGLLMGAYHFARPLNNAAADEAKHFLDAAKPYLTSGYLIPVLDLESGSTLGIAALSKWANDWCSAVQKATGLNPLIYTGTFFATHYVNATVATHPLWIANWPTAPDPQTGNPPSGVWPTWQFWQYADNGIVPGIAGGVDLDVYVGDLTALKKNFLIQPSAPPTAAISGSIFNDVNKNGRQDATEPALAGWTVFLDADNDGVLDAGEKSIKTDAAGHYLFQNLAAGKYFVREVLQTGWKRTFPSSAVYTLNLPAAQRKWGNNFLNTRIA